MARLGNELDEIQKIDKELRVTPYTIKYDPNAVRLFKAHGPKVASGMAVTGVVFAGLSALTLATGGVFGAVVAPIVAASVASGVMVPTIYSFTSNLLNSDLTPRFKALGIGGNEDEVGTIEVIQEREAMAREYRELLSDFPRDKKFDLESGETYSRRDLIKKAKRQEQIVYQGLKYLLNQGMMVSEKINALTKKPKLTEREKNKLQQYYGIMDRIGLSVANMASSRLEFNPYKNLIMNYLEKGCLLGSNDEENRKIKAVAVDGSKKLVKDLYSSMYELPLLQNIKKQREIDIEAKQKIREENKVITKTRRQLIINDGRIDKIDKENQKLAKQINYLAYYQALIIAAEDVAQIIPTELTKEQKTLYKTIDNLKLAVKQNNKADMYTVSSELTNVVYDILDKTMNVLDNRAKAKFQKQVDKYKNRYERVVGMAWNKRTENKNLRKRAEDAEAVVKVLDSKLVEEQEKSANLEGELDNAVQGWYEAEQRVEKQTKKYEGAVKRTAIKRAESKHLRKRAEDAEAVVKVLDSKLVEEQEKSANLEGELDNAVQGWYEAEVRNERRSKNYKKVLKSAANNHAKAQYYEERAKSAEGLAEHLYGDKVALEEKLAKEQEKSANLEKNSIEFADTALNLQHSLNQTKKQLAEIESDRDAYKAQSEDLHDKIINLKKELKEQTFKADILQAEIDAHEANFVRGGHVARLNNWVDKIMAHVEYTEEQSSYDEYVTGELRSFVRLVTRKNIETISNEEIKAGIQALKKAYSIAEDGLAPISQKRLSKLTEDRKKSKELTR